MHEAIEILEKYGVVRDADSLRVTEIVGKRVEQLHEELFSAIVTKQEEDYYAGLDNRQQLDPFTFLAGRSLGGDVCSEFDCRVNRLDMLGRYAALYSNQVILPLPLTTTSKLDGPKDAIRELSQASLALVRLRPIIDAGIVYPVVRRSFHCEHTLKWCEDMKRIVYKATDHMLDTSVDDFVVKFQIPEKAPTGIPSIYIEGPEDFLEHGERILLFGEMPGWRLKKWKFDKEGKVEVRGLRKAAVLSEIFAGIGEDTSFYLAYGRNRNARLLTNLRGEAMLLQDLTSDVEVSASSAALNDCMSHTLPLLADLPISRLLAIRRDERDSFERYRLAIRQILVDVSRRGKRISKREVRQLFQEQIEPELAKMKSELYQERRRQRRRIGAGLTGLAAMAAGVALGAFGGIVPGVAAAATGISSEIMPAIAKAAMAVAPGIAGTSLLGKAAQSYCEHGATLKEKNDFYFLLRLTQEAEG
ncbi:MAG: hypothetical protein WA213_10960 [Terriglobales bacterium]